MSKSINPGKAALMLVLFIIIIFFLFTTTFTNKEQSIKFSISDKASYKTLSGEILDDFKLSQNNKLDLNLNDSVYINTKSADNFTFNSEKNIFTLSSGLYLFNLYDLSNNYLINGKGFSLTPNSPGIFYLEINSSNDIKIYSIDSSLNVDFFSLDGKEKYNSITIFPNINISFNSTNNLYVKGADYLRTQFLLKFSYNKNPFIYNGNKLIYNNYDNKNGTYNESEKEFLEQSLFNIIQNNNYFLKNNSLLTSNVVSGLKYIKKYYFLFLNEDKKLYYIKNNIIDSMNLIIDGKKIYKSLIADLTSDFELYKSLNNNEFNDFENIIEYYYKYSTISPSENNQNSNMDFYNILKLYQSIKGTNSNNKIVNSSFYLNRIFSYFNKEQDNNLNKKIFNYLDELFKENSISIDLDKINLTFDVNNESQVLLLKNLSFYLKNIINDYSKTYYSNDLLSYYSILKYYFIINTGIGSIPGDNQDNVIETNLVEFLDFYIDFIDKIRTNYFEEELTDKGLLELKDDIPSEDQITEIYNLLFLFNEYYKKNKKYISAKNFIKSKNYGKYYSLLEQYKIALINYDEYFVEFDKVTNDMLGVTTISQLNNDYVLSISNLTNYLSQFVGIDISTLDAEIVGDYYKINSVYLNGNKSSFDIYPKELNTITNFEGIGLSKYKNNSYELDSLKKTLDENLASSSEYNIKNDFKYFFINTFFSDNEREIKNYQIVENKEEDKVIMIFKRDRLFGTVGDFSIIKSFFKIDSNDVDVKKTNENYNIFVKKATYLKYFQELNYKFNFNGYYYLNVNNSYYFDNLKSTVSIIYDSDEEPLLGGNMITYLGKFDTLKLKDLLNVKTQIIIDSNFIYNTISKNIDFSDMNITLDENNILHYEFNFNDNQIEILFDGLNVTYISKNGVDYLNGKTINNQNLLNYLLIITKK